VGEYDPHALPHTHTKPDSIGQSGRWQSTYHDAMIDYDKNVGTVLKALDDLGISDSTFVTYATDNGPHMNSWPDGAMTPWLLRIVGALTAPTFMPLTGQWRSRPQHQKRTSMNNCDSLDQSRFEIAYQTVPS
jgi:arylsulfatase A-like enzyme